MQNFLLRLKNACSMPKRLHFLGFIVSEGTVHMDGNKVAAVLKWPVPQSVKEVQRFLGFSNLGYRRFYSAF